MNKKEALQKIVDLANRHHLNSEDIISALRKNTVPTPSLTAETNWLNTLYSYIGGILIFAGICVLITMKWQSFNIYERVTLTLGFGFSAFIFAFLCLNYPNYKKASTPLFLIALFLEPTGLIILLQEYSFMMPLWGVLAIAVVYVTQLRLAIESETSLILTTITVIFGLTLFVAANDNNRIILNLGLGFLTYILGICCKKTENRFTAPIFLVAAILEASGLLTFLSMYTPILLPTWGVLITSFILLFQFSIALLNTKQPILAFITLIFLYSFFLAVFELLGVPERLKWFVLSSSLLCISSFINHSKYQSIVGLLFFISSIILLSVTFDIVRDQPYDVLYLGLCTGLIYLAIIENSRIVLFNASIATICFILYFSSKYFSNAIGWPITLILIGLLLVGFSGIILKLKKKYM